MRGQALSNTRKLNKHWQSGEGGLTPLGSGPWFNCATYKGHLYQFPLRYGISTGSNFPFNRLLKPYYLDGSGAHQNPNVKIGTNGSYVFTFPPKPFSGVWNYNSSTGVLGEYEIYPNIKLIPSLGNCPCFGNVNVYYHNQNGQRMFRTIVDPYNDDIYTMSLLVDIVCLRTLEDYTTGDTRLAQSLSTWRIPESMLTQFLTTPVMVPVGFNPLWQTSDFLDQYFYCVDGRYNALASQNQVNLLCKTREDSTGYTEGLEETPYMIPFTPGSLDGKYNANNLIQVTPVFNGQVHDVDNILDTSALRTFSGVTYGYSLPYCDGTGYGTIPNYPNDELSREAWLRRLTTCTGYDLNAEFDYEHRNQNWIGYAVILKQIIPEKRTLL